MDDDQQHTELYEILGVTKDSSDAEIKKNYRKLAKEFHPDKNPEAGDKFKEISFAYEVLSNPDKRKTYDQYGIKGLQEGADNADASDFFSQWFPFGGKNDGHAKLKPLVAKLEVTLEEIYRGEVTKTVSYKRTEFCSDCKGLGAVNEEAIKKCSSCGGLGRTANLFMGIGAVETVCHDCAGRGTMVDPENHCKACHGHGLVEMEHSVDVTIDKGVPNLFKYSFPAEGNQPLEGERGDLVVVVTQKDHPVFLRRQNDLFLRDIHINLAEALCGFVHCFQHLDGRTLCISSNPGEVIQHGSVKLIPNEGMPIRGNPLEHGDVIVKFAVDFPDNNFATKEQLELLETVLPPREPFVMPEDPEEVQLVDAVPYGSDSQGAYGINDDDDDENEGPRIGGVQCQTA